MTDHLAEDILSAHVFAQAPLSEQAVAHLAICAGCRVTLTTLQRMADEMRIARQSEPSLALRSSAYQLFARIQQAPSWLERMVLRLRAELIWDSRQQLAAQGLRAAPAERYHLLYATNRIEVEMSVQPRALGFDLEGDLLPIAPDDSLTPALLHLQPADPQTALYETRSDPDGHFRLQGVAPGHYALLITPPTGALLEIEGLEFA
jgi:hypothetical protein